MDIPQCVVDGLQHLSEVIKSHLSVCTVAPLLDSVAVVEWNGCVGRPKFSINRDILENQDFSMNLPLTTLADVHGISRSTLYRRMREHDL